MLSRFRLLSAWFVCNLHICVLAFLWFAGLLCGTALSKSFPEYTSLMCVAATDSISSSGAFAVISALLLVSGVALMSTRPGLIYICIFLIAGSLGASISSIVFSYGYAAWFVHALLLFSNIVMSLVSLWFLLQPTVSSGRVGKRLCICVGIGIATGIIDYLYISPFIAGLTF